MQELLIPDVLAAGHFGPGGRRMEVDHPAERASPRRAERCAGESDGTLSNDAFEENGFAFEPNDAAATRARERREERGGDRRGSKGLAREERAERRGEQGGHTRGTGGPSLASTPSALSGARRRVQGDACVAPADG
eukprot:9492827-Pyramimonas_sp.AAC.1